MSSPEDARATDESAREGTPAAPAVDGLAERVRRSTTWADLIAVGVVLAVAVVGYLTVFDGFGGAPPGAGLAPGTARLLMALPPRTAIPATLDLEETAAGVTAIRPEGAVVGLSFRVHGESRPLVIEERARRETVVLFPPPGQGSVKVPAWQPVEVTDPGGGMYVVRDPPGPRRVRLVVFPPDVDPLAVQPTELTGLLPKLTIVERHYVAAFRE